MKPIKSSFIKLKKPGKTLQVIKPMKKLFLSKRLTKVTKPPLITPRHRKTLHQKEILQGIFEKYQGKVCKAMKREITKQLNLKWICAYKWFFDQKKKEENYKKSLDSHYYPK